MQLASSVAHILLTLLAGTAGAAKSSIPDDGFNHFQTEPNFRSLKVKILEAPDDPSILQPGYIFFAPFPNNTGPPIGPHIIDQNGDLIWYGDQHVGGRSQNFRPCSYQGEEYNHLCWSETGWDLLSKILYHHGQHRVLDNTYTSVGHTFDEVDDANDNPLNGSNPHEFNMLPDGRAYLQAEYELAGADLSPYNGPKDGYILDGCFREVDTHTSETLFSWCARNHLPLWNTYVFLPKNKNFTGELYGDGSLNTPWDYFHLNSVAKDDHGDYIVSGRHVDTIFKIAGTPAHGVSPGTILWRLGGKLNDFVDAELADLSRQHHATILSTTKEETTISFFNNQWLSAASGKLISNGEVVTINNATKRVVSVKKYYSPEGYRSFAQGSTQVLANRNVLMGWGTIPQISEFSEDGTLLFHAHLAPFTSQKLGAKNEDVWVYRTFKFPWIGRPQWSPKLLAYSPSCNARDSGLTAYVSWNGATAVRYWKFHTSYGSINGPWSSAGVFAKNGFETKAYLKLKSFFHRTSGFPRFVSVQALDENYNILATTTSETFVPGQRLNSSCADEGCFEPLWFDYDSDLSEVGTCTTSHPPIALFAFIFLVCLIESMQRYVVRRLTTPTRCATILPTNSYFDEKKRPALLAR